MNRRFLSLLLLFIASLVLWFTSRWWLPWLLSQLPLIQANADLIQAIEALVSIAWIVFSAIIAYFAWLYRPRQTRQSADDLETAALKPTTSQQLRHALGQGGNVNWIDRGATSPADLRRYGRIVITGRSGLGKSREAAELIRRAVDDDLVSIDRIFVPGPAVHTLTVDAVRSSLLRSLDPYVPLLLFVEDLPRHFTGGGLERLAGLFGALRPCKDLYIIATARSDQLTPDHDAWLAQQHFQPCPLPDLSPDNTTRLVDSAADLFSLQVSDGARQAFASASNGTPQLPLMALNLLRAQGHDQVDADDARRVLADRTGLLWAETRRYIVDPQRAPAAAYILDALGYFYAARVDAYESLALPFAAQLARQAAAPRALRSQRALRRALAYLAYFDVRTVDGIITFRDEVASDAPDSAAACQQSEAFLRRHRRVFHRPLLRRLYPSASQHRWAVFDLALESKERQDCVHAIDLYTLALQISPHFGIFNNRGNARSAQGDLPGAIADFDQAITLDPKYAPAYSNRGLARRAQGDLPSAIADYDQAITLDPQLAPAYYNRGVARSDQGDLPGAIADYDQAITLDPKYAKAYSNRGNARSDQGDLPGAIADFDQAITLDPQYAAAYNNRGLARSDQGDLPGAIADYDQAITLNPEFAAAYSNKGIALRQLDRLDEAAVAHKRAAEIDPQRLIDWMAIADIARRQGNTSATQQAIDRARPLLDPIDLYNAACFHSIAAEPDQALEYLAQALAANPSLVAWAQQDPDLSWIRTDQRFAALIAEYQSPASSSEDQPTIGLRAPTP